MKRRREHPVLRDNNIVKQIIIRYVALYLNFFKSDEFYLGVNYMRLGP